MHRFLRLPRSEQCLLLQALLLVGAIRLGLWVLPFRFWHRLIVRSSMKGGSPPSLARPSRERVAWAVRTASRFVPAATCLTQALATLLILGRMGYPARLRIGVARGAAGAFEAHAWVESEGTVVIGGSEAALARFTALPPLEGGRE